MHTQTSLLRRSVGLCLMLLMVLLLPRGSYAQVNNGDDVPQVTRTYVLQNARVVQAPGRVLERATVVIRDGLLVAIGPDAAIPFDAEHIAADSLTVYAGFIDGLSHAGIPKPKEEQNQERPDNPGDPPDDQAGIQPGRDVRAMLDPKEKSLADMRKAGFTAAHVVPYGRMLPGSGAVILLSGDDANDLVFKGDASLFAQFETARRMYPGTDMAVMAKMRQLYREAQRRQRIEQLYADNPTGLARPDYDPVHYAFFPVLNGEKQVYFNAEDVLDLHRVLAVHEDLGFPLVLTGLNQSFDALDKLVDAGVPLFLTLDLPTPPKKDGKGDKPAPADSTTAPPADAPTDLPAIPQSDYDPAFRTLSHADLEAEKKNLEARQEMERKKYYGNAGALHKAGLTFGFSTMDAKPGDVMKNVRTMIENGLPEDVALAALTTNPAQILGVTASMGTVEVGKMGNLVVTTGPVFAEDAQIRYVFIDGEKFEIEAEKKKSTSGGDGAVNPAGVWAFTVTTPQGDVSGTITIEGNAGDWTGVITNDQDNEPADMDDITLEDDVLSFTFDNDEMGTISVTMTISGEDIAGTVSVPGLGDVPIAGSRSSGPGF